MYWVLGLGNPGPQYLDTRHNAGFLAVDLLAENHGIRIDHTGCHAFWGSGRIAGCDVLIAKPVTYMNESGVSARAFIREHGLDPENLIVLHDEIDLPLGKVKRKFGGGSAGQRGVSSIIHRLGTDRFHRVRIGIGRPESRDDIVDYVLSEFTEDERAGINLALDSVAGRVEEILKELQAKPQPGEGADGA